MKFFNHIFTFVITILFLCTSCTRTVEEPVKVLELPIHYESVLHIVVNNAEHPTKGFGEDRILIPDETKQFIEYLNASLLIKEQPVDNDWKPGFDPPDAYIEFKGNVITLAIAASSKYGVRISSGAVEYDLYNSELTRYVYKIRGLEPLYYALPEDVHE